MNSAIARLTELYGSPMSAESPYEKRAAETLARCLANEPEGSSGWVETYVILLEMMYRLDDFLAGRPQAPDFEQSATSQKEGRA